MERQRQVDAAMVSALRAERGLSRARAEDDKALKQSRYDSELVETRAAFEAEKREMLLESERNDEKWRTEILRFKNEVLDASLAIREQARLDGDELRASLAQKDRTITLLERADAEKQTAALVACPRCEGLKLEVLKLTTRVVSQIEEERLLNAVVDARDLQIRILEGEAHESNINLNMFTDMNGELQSDLLSREELRSERKVLKGTAAELVSAQAALAQERVRLDEAKRGFAAKVADERALFDEERRSWLTQLSNDRSQADLERREMNIAMQAERSQLLSERLELLRVPPPTPNQPNVVSAVGYETAHPVQQPDYLHDSTLWSRLWLRRWERTPRFVRSRTVPHLPLRVAVAMAVTGTIRADLEKAHMVRVDSVGAADPEGMVVMAVEIRLRIDGLVRTHTPKPSENTRGVSTMPPKISSCNILMRCQRQLDAAMVSALRAELGLSRARAGDDKALEQSRYDSELVQTRAAFEAEKREMLLESERNDEKWRTEFLRFKNEVLDASLAIREQARLDGDELRASLAQKDKTITLLERADAEKQTAALEVCPRCEELKLEVLKLTTRVVSQIEEERRLNAVADTRDLQIRILEGEAHESNVNLNMLTDMNGELQSELLSQEELRSERNVLEGTAAELVTKVADERALFDEERRSWLTQLSNDRSQADLERREMNIAMQAERSQLLSERLELLRVPATPNQPNVVSAVGYETAHPVQQPDYLHDST
ncbi:hypothetical protein DYB37_012959, partial [Aphanomyces astaci]